MIYQQKLNQEALSPITDKLSFIRCPVLLIKGKYDPVCSENQTESFLSKVKNSSTIVFENSAHMPRHEEPELFAKTVGWFVEHKC